MTVPPLEDEFGDVIAKARRGLGLTLDHVSQMAGLDRKALERLEACQAKPSEAQARRLGEILELRGQPLVELATGTWTPDLPGIDRCGPWKLHTLELHNQAGFTSNTYFLWSETAPECVVVDPGFDAPKILAELARLGLRPCLVAVTHGHHDHVGQAARIAATFKIPAFIGSEDIAIVPPEAG
ncbi:MAG: MBL fold metallo-hydrolase, partial [Cyanobacteria bacterium REEB65]|nr:MBL fold metallo-hydrolase [Cyanobacteria bacterium REEB65]